MKKFKILTAVFAIALLTLCGCAGQKGVDVPSVTGVDKWYFYNEALGESEVMTLGEDGMFMYNCECGEPIGDSDIYDEYYYDEEEGILHIYASYDEEEFMDMKVLKLTPYEMMIESEGEIKTFAPEFINDSMSYFGEEGNLSGNNGYFTVMDVADGKVKLAPFNYDGDVEYPEEAFSEYDLADGVKFFEMEINSKIDDSGEVHHTHYEEMSKADAEKLLEDSSANGFIWFNGDMTIEKIVFYGQTIVME